MSSAKSLRLGLVINPFAGLGGPRARKGSDDGALLAQAIDQQWALTAPERCRVFLQELPRSTRASIAWYSVAGVMGGDSLAVEGIEFTEVACDVPRQGLTNAEHTQALVRALANQQLDLLLFVGGDGTARDVLSELPSGQVALGIPAGVKMQSGVYAISPQHAAELVVHLVEGDLVRVHRAEVRDIDEAALRQGRVNSRWFGEMLTLDAPQYVQHTKQGGIEQEALVILDIAEYLQELLEPEALCVVGPGSTTYAIMQEWHLQGTLLGVDIVQHRQLLASDVTAQQLEQIVANTKSPVHILVTAIGGQGHVLGRGNQQITAPVLRRAGREQLHVVATRTKLKTLAGRPLYMDTGDASLDREWSGYIPVITGFNDQILYPLGHIDDAQISEQQ